MLHTIICRAFNLPVRYVLWSLCSIPIVCSLSCDRLNNYWSEYHYISLLLSCTNWDIAHYNLSGVCLVISTGFAVWVRYTSSLFIGDWLNFDWIPLTCHYYFLIQNISDTNWSSLLIASSTGSIEIGFDSHNNYVGCMLWSAECFALNVIDISLLIGPGAKWIVSPVLGVQIKLI